jgi:tetratricopeptide (TPR) repeat protein
MKRNKIVLIVVLSFIILFPTSSSGKESWIKLQSKNFTVIGNAGEDDITKLATSLEEFRHALSLLFPKANIETPVPTTVFLFKSHDSFRPFKPQYKGKTRDNVGGYFRRFPDGNYIALTNEAGGGDPLEVIFHEYEHFVVRNNLPNAPLWLNEGLAEYFSSFKTSDDYKKATLGYPKARHILTLREGHLLPLETLLAVNSKSPHYNENGKVGIFYAESWALIHYLILGNGGKRLPELSKFISGVSAGTSLEENFRQSFQADYKKIESELRSYVDRFAFPVLNITFAKELDFAKEMQKAPMTDAEVQFYLGDLLFRGGRFDEAENYFQKSLKLDANFTSTKISLGILRMYEKKLPEAEQFFQSAITLDPANYLGHLNYARALRQEERYEEAVKSYQQAIQLKPGASQPHTELGYVYRKLGKEEEALEAFKLAVRLDPMNTDVYRLRSYVYLELARGYLAATDASTYLKRQGWQDEHSSYMVVAFYFGLKQQKEIAPARKLLEQASTRLIVSEWPYPVLRYLKQEISVEELLALATDNDKLTEAHAYIGLDLSLNGKSKEAMPHLQWVAENGNKNFVEYPLALSEIERIKAKGN